MTPAIKLAETGKIQFNIHQYEHDASAASYGDEAAEKLGVSTGQVFKTLVAQLDGKELVVAVLPVACQLSLKLLAKAAGGKKAVMAAPHIVEKTTGYVLGGVSPLGQKKRLRTFLDEQAQSFSTIYISAGKRGLEIELSPADLLALTNGTSADIATD